MNTQKAIGIDPGLANTGYAIVTRNKRGAFRILASGCIQTDKQTETPKRMLEIYTGVTELLHTRLICYPLSVSFGTEISRVRCPPPP